MGSNNIFVSMWREYRKLSTGPDWRFFATLIGTAVVLAAILMLGMASTWAY